MMDYRCVLPDGSRILVSQMAMVDILDCLNVGFVIISKEHNETAEKIIDRLQIELLIRELGL